MLCTCPDRATADTIAGELVRERLAACVNVIEGITSVYAWEGRINSDPECLLLMKTRRECFERLRDRVVGRHPYELPEVVAVALDAGLAGYLAWIDRCVDVPS